MLRRVSVIDLELVGRGRELDAIGHLLDTAARGVGGVVVFTGPEGSGKTALADAASAAGHARDFTVVRASPVRDHPGRLVWAQLLRDVRDAGAGPDADTDASRLLDPTDPSALDRAARTLVAGVRRLIVVDDVDHGGEDALEMLALVAARAAGGGTAVVATATRPPGIGTEMPLRPLDERELAAAAGDVRPDARRALWIASRGRPGLARSLAAGLDALGETEDPVVHLALHARTGAGFLEVDAAIVRLLEDALARPVDGSKRARLLARLASELLGDAAAASRRRTLADEALNLARASGDAQTLAEVLDARLYALWDPQGAADRLATASEIVDLARAAGDAPRERDGVFWRFVALMELGRVDEAESALAAFEREAAAAGDAEAVVMATARHAMLAILHGRFDEALRLADEVAAEGERIGLPDTTRLVNTLRGAVLFEGAGVPDLAVEEIFDAARGIPGQLYEAFAARVLVELDRHAEARVELDRLLPGALEASGPRWLGAMADLAAVASATGDADAAALLSDALLPYRGRLVVWAGANTVRGPVSHYLGVLAVQLGALDDAVHHLEEAVALEETIGAVPDLARSLDALAGALDARDRDGDRARATQMRERARTLAGHAGMTRLLQGMAAAGDEWALRRDGDDWLLDAGAEHARLRDGRGLHYLRMLLATPGREVAALDLVAGGSGLVDAAQDPVLDDEARRAYRRRLDDLDAALDASDRAGDATRAARLSSERDAVLAELRRASGLGGRAREITAEAERARVNVTRTLRATVERIAPAAPRCAEHLRASLRTGRFCRYEPAAGGPGRWRV